MKVQDIMTQPVHTCTISMDLAAASRRMRDTGCGALVVLNQGRLAGIITDRDLALSIGKLSDPTRLTVGKVMSYPVHLCRREDDVHTALNTMSLFKVRRLPVISQTGDVEGVISIDDIILWGVPKSAVSLHKLTAALRAICSASTAAVQEAADV
jgi:CBS domain-containing protein